MPVAAMRRLLLLHQAPWLSDPAPWRRLELPVHWPNRYDECPTFPSNHTSCLQKTPVT